MKSSLCEGGRCSASELHCTGLRRHDAKFTLWQPEEIE